MPVWYYDLLPMKKSIYPYFYILLALCIIFWRTIAKLLGLEIDFSPRTEKVLGTIERLILSLLWIKVIIKSGYAQFNGLCRRKIANPYALLPPVGFVLLLLGMKLLSLDNFRLSDMAIIAMFYLSVGMSEELLMRGIVFPFLIEKLGTSKKMIFLAALLSSIIFGLFHSINLMSSTRTSDEVLGQVVTAVPIGFFFAALLLKVENIWAVAFLHGLVNFALGNSDYTSVPKNEIPSNPESVPNLCVTILFYLIFIGIFYNGVLIIKKIDHRKVKHLLNEKKLPKT